MVDRAKRDAARDVLRGFIDCKLTNDDFFAQFPRSEHDSALQAISANVWMLYSDLRRHKLTGKYAPNAEARAMLERCVLFLGSGLEFEWPVPTIGLANIVPNLRRRIKQLMGPSPDSEGVQAESKGGDETVWPFFRRSDYNGRGISD